MSQVRILVDADACPVKEEVYRVAERRKVPVAVVSNSPFRVPIDPLIERVTLVKPVRVGFTTLLTGAVGAYVANEPAPILALLPTESDCRDASPASRGALSADQEEGERQCAARAKQNCAA